MPQDFEKSLNGEKNLNRHSKWSREALEAQERKGGPLGRI